MTRSGKSRDSAPVNRASHDGFDESFRDSIKMNETIGSNLYDPGNSDDDDDSSSGEGQDDMDRQNRMASETLASNDSRSAKRP